MMGESEHKAREREQTVLKYKLGVGHAEVLPGEEGPASQDNVDFYGFIFESSVPKHILDKQMRIRQRELKREKKWEKLLVTNDNYQSPSNNVDSGRIYGNSERHLDERLVRSKKGVQEKLVRRVYKGIPTKLRSLVWADLLRYRGMIVYKDTYEEMVARAHKYSPDIHQIDLDVNRTYRNTTFFRERYGPRQRQLFDVLAAYSMYNTDVGYCQGMSEIAAFLLMHLNEEAEVFWALHTLFTDRHWQMHGFFIKGFPKLTRFFEHHDRLLAKHLPRLHKHLKKLDIHPSCYAFKWYMQCFIGLPYTLTLRLWDIFLVIGEKLLVMMSFNIMKIIRSSVMKMDQSEVLVFMQEPLRQRLAEFDDDKVIDSLKEIVHELQFDWRPPLDAVAAEAEGPPPASHFGRLPPPDYLQLVQQRQFDQSDVEATLRRSLRRSASPRPHSPSSTSNQSPQKTSPTISPSGLPPSQQSTQTFGVSSTGTSSFGDTHINDNNARRVGAHSPPAALSFAPAPITAPMRLPTTDDSSIGLEPPPSPYDNAPVPMIPVTVRTVPPPEHLRLDGLEVDGERVASASGGSRMNAVVPRSQAGPNGTVQATQPVKSHSLPEDVTLAVQLDVLAGGTGSGNPYPPHDGPTRRIRSQASSPLDAGATTAAFLPPSNHQPPPAQQQPVAPVARPFNYETAL